MCSYNHKTLITYSSSEEQRYLTMITDMEARLAVIEADQLEIRADQATIRADQAEIRASFQELGKEIAIELKHSQENLDFMKNLNAQMDAALIH